MKWTATEHRKKNNITVGLINFNSAFADAVDALSPNISAANAHEGKYDIVAIGESGCDLNRSSIKADIVLCPQDGNCKGSIECNGVISCGMSRRSTVSFTSIGEQKAMLAVNRSIRAGNRLTEQCEMHCPFDRNLSIYENLVLSAIRLLDDSVGKDREVE